MIAARHVCVRGVVQGVGFRPFVFLLARTHGLGGWVSNQESGVELHVEGDEDGVQAFLRDLAAQAPAAARVAAIEATIAAPAGLNGFRIRETRRNGPPTVRISPDLAVCPDCLRELRDPADPRYRYPYINCTNCGPRYTVIERLPYDRGNTTMREWELDALCGAEYRDPANRRFHAQPVACPSCGPPPARPCP